MTMTKGYGIINHTFKEYLPVESINVGERKLGVLVSVDYGKATAYAIGNLEDRGTMFIEPGTEVYEGMIAEAIAKRDKVRIAPTGAYALYRLGLSTQIPANVVFITDGSPRRVTIGKGRGILFKHTSEMRTFAYQSSLMALIVTALREIGEGNATEQQKAIIKKHLENVSEKDFSHDITLAPIWVRKELTALWNIQN